MGNLSCETVQVGDIRNLRITGKNPGLLNGLRRSAAAIVLRSVGGESHKRQPLIVGLNDGWQQFRGGSAAGGHDGDGARRGADTADGEEAGGAFLEVLPEPNLVPKRGEHD